MPDATTELAQTAIQNPDVFPVSAAKATRGFGFGEGTGLGTVPDLAPAPSAADAARAAQLNMAFRSCLSRDGKDDRRSE